MRKLSSVMTTHRLKEAMKQKLLESTLTLQDARVLQMKAYTAVEVTRQFPKLPAYRAGILIPYFDLKGKRTDFYRVRYLEYGIEHGFGALVAENLKKLRYGQSAKTLNELYLPPFIEWQKVAQDPKHLLVITEGEFKSACATKHGIPTIGLGVCGASRVPRMACRSCLSLANSNGKRGWCVSVTTAMLSIIPTSLRPKTYSHGNCVSWVHIRISVAYPHCIATKRQGWTTTSWNLVSKHSKPKSLRKLRMGPTRELFKMNEEVVYVEVPVCYSSWTTSNA